MRIFKFGGASVKDAAGVKNVYDVLQKVGFEDVMLVVSAMGKTTNGLELVVKRYFEKSPDLSHAIREVKEYHHKIMLDLFETEENMVFNAVNKHFSDIDTILNINKSPNYDFVYDEIVSMGEIISTTILSHYFSFRGMENNWVDVRNLIKTDTTYRDAIVDWKQTEKLIASTINQNVLNITQGFIGSDPNFFTTTLGREGSDYTAAIFAYCLNAESVTIWKDVPGVLNADPRYFNETTLLNQISYREAIELAFYGASVIHPKTLQPLQNKEIPLYVKSFINPLLPGTKVSKGQDLEPAISCFIVKKDQKLISFASRDFSFIMEENISEIFNHLSRFKIKVSLIQNTAISFEICVEDKFDKVDELYEILNEKFNVVITNHVDLYTIRHFNQAAIDQVAADKNILVKQVSKETVQLVAQS
ncbi:aspartate kinase [Flavobacterium agricola]|uniref:Aspartokinase n=1 Tax=Flavobacterium agricola TaxID=2870839 RepID=A0ABY6M029_9FLAO|nr:aspartate kinase [Flavobacterium agricola]UYW01182.1 aspartate kinase [Flavobacterium agricola]